MLLVEDDELVGRAIARGLVTRGFIVDVATDGGEARARALAGRYDAFLLDRILPDDDGLSICSFLRRRGVRAPIFIITAAPTEDTEIDAFGIEADADDYIAKPVDCAVLAARIAAACRKAADRRPLVRFGGLAIDLDARIAYLDDRRIALTGHEYSLLAILAERPGEIVAKEDLIRRLWSDRKAPIGNALDVQLNRLRLKLRDAARQIVTVKGRGFRLDR